MTHGEEVRTRHSSSLQTSGLADLPLKYFRSAACEICGMSTFLCQRSCVTGLFLVGRKGFVYLRYNCADKIKKIDKIENTLLIRLFTCHIL